MDLAGWAVADTAHPRRPSSQISVTFSPGTAVSISGGTNGYAKPRIFDIDGDTKADAVMASGARVFWAPGKGDGTFGTVRSTDALGGSLTVADYAFGDFDGDTTVDLVLLSRDANAANPTLGIAFLKASAPGTFAAPGTPTPIAKGIQKIVSRDLDGDGKDDLAALSDDPHPTSEPSIYVLSGSSNGPVSPVRYPFRATGRVDIVPAKLTSAPAVDLVAVGQMGGSTGDGDAYLYRGY